MCDCVLCSVHLIKMVKYMYLLLQRADCPALIAEPDSDWLLYHSVPLSRSVAMPLSRTVTEPKSWVPVPLLFPFKCYSVLKIFKLN